MSHTDKEDIPMKVILLEDVKALGKAGELVEVKPGYANNALLPQGKALEATAANLNMLKTKQKAEAAKAKQRLEEARQLAEQVRARQFEMAVKSGEGGRLYGSVTNQDIADLLAQAGFKVDKRGITFPATVKNLGEHLVDLKLHPEVSVQIKVLLKAL